MNSEADSFKAFQSVTRQIDEALKLGLITKEEARTTLTEARVSYSKNNMARVADIIKRRKKR